MRLHTGLRVLVAASLGLPFLAAPARAEFIGFGMGIVRIDERTAEGTVIRPTTGYYPVSMAMCPSGTVYFVGGRWYGEEAYVGTIDPVTWAISSAGPDLSGSIIVASQVRAVEFSADGTFFAITPEGGEGGALHTIDPQTGVATLVGSTGLMGPSALAFSPDGTLYAWDWGTSSSPSNGLGLVTIDPLTGLATDVNPALGETGDVLGLGFAPDGTLYGAWKNLFIVDTATGELTLVGPLVVPPDGYFGTRSLVWIPEPSTLTGLFTLAATALLAHLCRRRRRVG